MSGFCWIVQEKEPPYIVTVIGIDEDELIDAAGRGRPDVDLLSDKRPRP